MTRTGKIARLPRAIRNTLGNRIRNAEPGTTLVTWLNSLPEVQAVMAELFDHRPITEQNLSEWKKEGGGYDDWLRHQESIEQAHTMREQAAELIEVTGSSPGDRTALIEDVTTLLVVALARQFRELTAKPIESSQDRRDLLAIAHELTRLRRVDQRAAQVKLQQDKRADELRREQEIKDRNAEHQRRYEAERAAQEAERKLHYDAVLRDAEAARETSKMKDRFLSEMGKHLEPSKQNDFRKLVGLPPLPMSTLVPVETPSHSPVTTASSSTTMSSEPGLTATTTEESRTESDQIQPAQATFSSP